MEGKRLNKLEFQRRMGLEQNVTAPIFFWPSRFDPVQKGCQLLAEIMYEVVDAYWEDGLQIAMVASGPFEEVFRGIVNFHGLHNRIAVSNFNEMLGITSYSIHYTKLYEASSCSEGRDCFGGRVVQADTPL